MKSPLRTYKKLSTFYFLLWGGWDWPKVSTPPAMPEGVDTRFTVVAGGNNGRFCFLKNLPLFGVLIQGAGGGEVSGGGTLYMKWRAGRNSASRTQQREQVVKHTLTLIFSHTPPSLTK
jgi:hypothetical protein